MTLTATARARVPFVLVVAAAEPVSLAQDGEAQHGLRGTSDTPRLRKRVTVDESGVKTQRNAEVERQAIDLVDCRSALHEAYHTAPVRACKHLIR